MSVTGQTSRAQELEIATQVVRVAGDIALRQYGRVERLTKTHATTTEEAVTIADRAVQRVIISELRKHFPSDGVIGEESDTGAGITTDRLAGGGRNWIIDPIDGTNNYIAGLGNWTVCLGLLEAGMPVLGIVFDPSRNVMYAGAAGVGSSANGKPCHAPTSPLSAASLIMLTANLLNSQGSLPPWAPRWLVNQWKIRMLGSAALEATLVGAGVAHAAITVNGKLWDCVAPAGFVLAAGGVVSGLDGSPVFPFDVSGYLGRRVPFLMAGPRAHAEILEELRR